MSECEQTHGQTILQHGESVHEYYRDLYYHIITGGRDRLKQEWRLPDWIFDPVIMERISPPSKLREYQVMHDLGKPYCRTIDADGRQHFPDHANISADLWLASDGDEFTGMLIRQDMDIHLISAEECSEFAQRPHAIDLLLTGLCEVHSNSRLFDGIDSVSSKIKNKRITQRGKRILAHIKENTNG